jgi:hypothetical protein
LARSLSAITVLITLMWSRDLLELAGRRGLVDPELSQALGSSQPLSLFHLVPAGLGSFDLALVLLLNAVALLSALLFWRPTSVLAAAGLYLAFTSLKQTMGLLTYGLYQYVQIGLFYVLAANLVAFLERHGEGGGRNPLRYVGLVARAHLAMAYFFAGACKAVGPQWWTGESMWRALARSDTSGQRLFDMSWTGTFPFLLQAIGILVVVAELTYPLAFVPKLRRFIVPAMILMHLGTIFTQGLVLFGLTMIALNVYFWLESAEWDDVPFATPKEAPASTTAGAEYA